MPSHPSLHIRPLIATGRGREVIANPIEITAPGLSSSFLAFFLSAVAICYAERFGKTSDLGFDHSFNPRTVVGSHTMASTYGVGSVELKTTVIRDLGLQCSLLFQIPTPGLDFNETTRGGTLVV